MDPKMSLRMLQLLIGGIVTGEVLPDVDEYFFNLPDDTDQIEKVFPQYSMLVRAYLGGGPSPANLDYCRDLIKG